MGFMNPVVGLLTVLRERIVRSVVCSHLDHMFCPDGFFRAHQSFCNQIYTHLNLEKRSRAHTHSRAACAAVVNAHTRHGGRGGVPVHEDHGVQDN
jgi:hypothetical protein